MPSVADDEIILFGLHSVKCKWWSNTNLAV